MEVAHGLAAMPNGHEPVFVVVGVFDGLHLGHEYLLGHLVTEARRRWARPMVITFDHHPDEILTGSAPPLLCDPEERLERMASAGVGIAVVVAFDARLRETAFEDFVAMIERQAPLAGFLMTPDAAFGFQRRGTPEALATLGAKRGFEVVVVPPFELDGRAVRSTDIRAAIGSGDLDGAARLLGRRHAVVGGAHDVDGSPGQGRTVRFALPVALPPPGRYLAHVAGDPEPETVSVGADGRLELRHSRSGPVRIAFAGGA